MTERTFRHRQVGRRAKAVIASAVLALGFTAGLSDGASALTIVRNFTAGTAATNVAGGGNLVSIFNAAADWWEMAIGDAHTVSIDFSWDTLSAGTLGVHNLVSQSGGRETAATIRFDNKSTTSWFLDATPHGEEEFGPMQTSEADLGGGIINTGRWFNALAGSDAVGRFDLLSIAKHEIGHSLGLSSANTAFIAEAVDTDIDVIGGPFAGSTIPLISGAHLNIGNATTGALMFPVSNSGVRKIQSAVDILANCQISGFTDCNLSPHFVPEPATMLLFGIGLVGLGAASRRRRAALAA